MFHPQQTPYSPSSPLSAYGIGNTHLDFSGYPSALGVGVGGSIVQTGGGPPAFRAPIYSAVNAHAHPHPHPHPHPNAPAIHSYNPNRRQYKMESNDLEVQEALAREYQPSLQGPLVGEKKSSHAITEEYAKADPIYVRKTVALPQTYSHYRPILGDGNCGWRAAGFSYFETLVRLGSKSQLEGEIARIESLNNLATTVGGFDTWLIEDMIEETTILLKDLAASIHDPPLAEQVLISRWNDSSASNGMVYHLRVLASSWLAGRPDDYINFITDPEGILGYRKGTLEPVNQEIDHVGMTLLIDVLLKPIGFAVEISYLDRSEGSQVTSHMFQAEDANGTPTYPNSPVIHLLYRPSHYDILYKDSHPAVSLQQPIAQAIQNTNLQVNRATNFTQQHNVQSTMGSMNSFATADLSMLMSIPGFAPAPSHHNFRSQYTPIDHGYAASPISGPISPVSPGPSSTASNMSLSTNFSSQPSALSSPPLNTNHTVQSPHATFPSTTQLPIHTHALQQPQPIRPSLSSHPSMSSPTSGVASPLSASSSFRPSKYEWEAAADWQEPPIVFQTSTFKNSHYNKAHYNNPCFQPEEWNPECEEVTVGGRKKSH